MLFEGCRGSDLQPGSSCLTRSARESGLAKPQGPIRNKEQGKGCDRRGWSQARAAAAREEGEDAGTAGSECLMSTAQLPRHGAGSAALQPGDAGSKSGRHEMGIATANIQDFYSNTPKSSTPPTFGGTEETKALTEALGWLCVNS